MSRRQIRFWELRDIYQFKCSRPRLFALNRDGFDIIGEPCTHFYRLAIAYVPRVEFVSAHFTLQVGEEAPGLSGWCQRSKLSRAESARLRVEWPLRAQIIYTRD